MTDYTPTELAARELISAARSMGVRALRGAVASSTLDEMLSLMGSMSKEAAIKRADDYACRFVDEPEAKRHYLGALYDLRLIGELRAEGSETPGAGQS